jgi:hypothetical protein
LNAVTMAALSHAPPFEMLFSDLNAELPFVTRLPLLTYRGWLAAPIIFAVLAA